jgi:hypothetical protein
VSFTPRTLCSLGKQPPVPIDMRLGALHSQYKHLGEEKISLTCWEQYHISLVAQTIGWSLQRLSYPDSFLVCTMGYIHIWIWQSRTGPIASGFSCTDKITVINYTVCLTTGRVPPPCQVLHTAWSSAISFFQYLLVSLRPSSSCLCLIPHLPITSILPSILPSIIIMAYQM